MTDANDFLEKYPKSQFKSEIDKIINLSSQSLKKSQVNDTNKKTAYQHNEPVH